jgi:mono/diheme cytochrome c family protein
MRVRLILFALLVAAGCSKEKAPVEEEEGAPAAGEQAAVSPDVAKGKEIFAQRCTPCHGATGAGDGPASTTLNPKPRTFTDPEWQKSVTDEHIQKIVKFGGAAVGKSPAMPGNPDLNDPTIAGLRVVVRSFKPN